ncbi:hypothetical protein swp_0781 [Shewanella piezotolerans WP3]|uniref:Uncharacterized protein n=1 Tax=Shewanella piezotolerans (strain WP3 / JCM 13877) TaxID=225849 RepID=B8CIW8_SHEPW|nr:hypothetical protein swp_0781 [Shewanella piezotolerans WP3]
MIEEDWSELLASNNSGFEPMSYTLAKRGYLLYLQAQLSYAFILL